MIRIIAVVVVVKATNEADIMQPNKQIGSRAVVCVQHIADTNHVIWGDIVAGTQGYGSPVVTHGFGSQVVTHGAVVALKAGHIERVEGIRTYGHKYMYNR